MAKIKNTEKLGQYAIYASWLIAMVGAFSSLYFSEVKRLVPCELCWYQRIFMYPQVFIVAVGLARKRLNEVPYYILPLSIVGTGISFYHVFLEQGFVPDTNSCDGLVACSQIQLELFGFLTIPMLSLAGFASITALMIFAIYQFKTNK